MDLKDQLKNLFPDHEPEENAQNEPKEDLGFWIPPHTVDCVYEKRKGKPVTVIRNYMGTKDDLTSLASTLKKELHVGGGIKNEEIVIQGDYRERIMNILKEFGFQIRRVGG